MSARSSMRSPANCRSIDSAEAVAGVEATTRRTRGDERDTAIRSALRQTVFRFELVMRINTTTHERLERQALLDAALAAQVALLTSEPRPERRRDSTYRERLGSRRDTLIACVDELIAAEEAMTTVERRYLDGRAALFPVIAAVWEEQLKSTQRLAVVALGLAEADGCGAFQPQEPGVISARATQLVADLVEPAKSTALEKLGEGERALGIARCWLRPKLEHAGVTGETAG